MIFNVDATEHKVTISENVNWSINSVYEVYSDIAQVKSFLYTIIKVIFVKQ